MLAFSAVRHASKDVESVVCGKMSFDICDFKYIVSGLSTKLVGLVLDVSGLVNCGRSCYHNIMIDNVVREREVGRQALVQVRFVCFALTCF